LLFIDLDGFKNVNDTLGHDAGDKLLVEVTRIIKKSVRRTSDSVSRLGGDEFTVILNGCKERIIAEHTAQEIINTLRDKIVINNTEVHIEASIGIAFYSDDGQDDDQLTRHADLAMYAAKKAGKNCYQMFSLEMEEHLGTKMQLERDLNLALEQGEFEVHYQPQINMPTGDIIGAEALLRWNRKGVYFTR